jgi:hypothetical protein
MLPLFFSQQLPELCTHRDSTIHFSFLPPKNPPKWQQTNWLL